MADVLRGDDDLERMFREADGDLYVKGMFFRPFVNKLGGDFKSLVPLLKRAPRRGYVPFVDYPQVDHLLLLTQVARRLHPTCSMREALRRYSRRDIQTFAQSMFGKIIMSAVGDAWTALMTVPEVYRKVAGNSHQMSAERRSDGVTLILGRLAGPFSTQLGQCEGIAAHYGITLRTRVEVWDDRARFEFRAL